MRPDWVALAVDEAIEALGYVTPAARATIARMCTLDPSQHPRSIATAYRKAGEQISADEKRALGIRANGFMSREALGELTEAGRLIPLDAHFLTALRAGFTVMRFARLSPPDVQLSDGRYFIGKYDAVFVDRCRGCARLNGVRIDPATASAFPPHDCDVPGCALNISWSMRSPLMRYDD